MARGLDADTLKVVARNKSLSEELHFQREMSEDLKHKESKWKALATEARRDVEHGLHVTLDNFSDSLETQQEALKILQFKLDVLWSMLDAMQISYGIGEKNLGKGEIMPQ